MTSHDCVLASHFTPTISHGQTNANGSANIKRRKAILKCLIRTKTGARIIEKECNNLKTESSFQQLKSCIIFAIEPFLKQKQDRDANSENQSYHILCDILVEA